MRADHSLRFAELNHQAELVRGLVGCRAAGAGFNLVMVFYDHCRIGLSGAPVRGVLL